MLLKALFFNWFAVIAVCGENYSAVTAYHNSTDQKDLGETGNLDRFGAKLNT